MTTAADLLDELAGAGAAVSIVPDDPDALDLDGPAAALTPELVERVRRHKPELLAIWPRPRQRWRQRRRRQRLRLRRRPGSAPSRGRA